MLRLLWTTTNRAVLLNAGSLVGTTAVTAALGFVYWLVAARGFPPGEVGLASASISAMTLLGFVGMLGLGTMLMGELPRDPGRATLLVTTAVILSGLAGGLLGLLFAALAPLFASVFRPFQQDVGTITLFAVGVALTSASLVTDQALIGLLRGGLQLSRNAAFAAVKLGALVLVSVSVTRRTGITIYATWILGNLLSMAVLAAVACYRGWFRPAPRPQWSVLSGLRLVALGNHGLNLALQFPVLGLPILVSGTLTAAFNAYFYVAWMVAVSFVWVAPNSLSQVLFTVGSKTPAALGPTIRFTLGLSLMAGVLSNMLLPLIGNPILRMFGYTYVVHAGSSLGVMVLTVFPLIVKDHFVSLCRLNGRLGKVTALLAAGGLLELAGAATGAQFGGLAGLCMGWGAMICVEAVYMGPAVYRAATQDLRRHRASSSHTVPIEGEL